MLTPNTLTKFNAVHPLVGTPDERSAGIAFVESQQARALAALRQLEPRNREKMTGTIQPQQYYCLGCDVADGHLRAEILALAACPLCQLAAQQVLGRKLALQCYFPECYEEKAGPGPGGVIGTLPGKLMTTLDTSAARAFKMWHWVDADEPGYLPEPEARAALWQLAQQRFAEGLSWLRTAAFNNNALLGGQPCPYPPELKHHLHGLLGVSALQKIVTEELGPDVVLLDADRIILRQDLSWAALMAA